MVRLSMEHNLKRIHAYFYRTPAGNEPVREWLKKLPIADRRTIGTVEEDQMILLHGFVKTTRKTPDHEITLAYNRLRRGV